MDGYYRTQIIIIIIIKDILECPKQLQVALLWKRDRATRSSVEIL